MPRISQPDIPQLIKTKAARLGFCALGIAPAAPDGEMLRRLSSRPQPPYVPWEPEYRCSPQSWLPGARSVLAGAVPYFARYPRRPFSPAKGKGYLSPFAGEPDYHHFVADKLSRLGEYLLELLPGTKYTVQVDSGPGCERLYALRAGVGWQGKNNFIIVPGVGSFVWLGLIITNLELPPDTPLACQCGDCDLCLRACPTKAYGGANDYDYDRCMAYWLTTKKPLAPDQCTALSRHGLIYGCDFCQLACPHNLSGEAEGNWPDLRELLTMPAAEFKAFFQNTAALWRGSNVLRRNLVLAAAGSKECRDVLEKFARGQGLAAEAARAVLNASQGDTDKSFH